MEKQFPKNVRQIGNVCDSPKIYVEDYVDTFLNLSLIHISKRAVVVIDEDKIHLLIVFAAAVAKHRIETI